MLCFYTLKISSQLWDEGSAENDIDDSFLSDEQLEVDTWMFSGLLL